MAGSAQPAKQPQPSATAAGDDEEEDDYMTMVFDDTSAAGHETSLQRHKRERREAAERGRVKSRAQLAAEEEEAREKALGTSMLADPAVTSKSKGFAMMAKMGFKGGALGRKDEKEAGSEGSADVGANTKDGPRTEPIRISIKEDRGGIGMESEKKRKFREAAEAAESQVKKAKADEGEYRDRVRRERELARLEKQVHAAQKVAERMDEDREPAAGDVATEAEDQDETGEGIAAAGGEKRKQQKTTDSRLLKSINVLWRGLARTRDEAERDRRMRYDLEQSLSRLPTYEDEHEDEDYKRAMGKSKTVFVTAEDLDEEDPELDEFNALPPDERLLKLVEHLRKEHRYCFWCRFVYPDEAMEGCPGLTEEDHD